MGLEIFDLTGKSAIVTGGSKGLGQAMAQALAEVGADVLITSRHQVEVDAAAAEIARATGRKVIGLEADVTKRDEVEGMAQRALDAFGKIDILVNNAGINIRKPLLELEDEDWEQVVGINLTGPMLCARAVGRHMVERRSGKVINISSTLGVIGIPGRTPYASTKGGLIQFTRTLALEWAQHNINVNAICPGPFVTPLNRVLLDNPEVYQQFVSKIPFARFADPKEIHGAVIFLASEASSYVTGSCVFVDGGWTAH